jgi:hypothetical protein
MFKKGDKVCIINPRSGNYLLLTEVIHPENNGWYVLDIPAVENRSKYFQEDELKLYVEKIPQAVEKFNPAVYDWLKE